MGLVGCVKQKGQRPLKAKDLYESALFRGRRAYVERTCDEWWILSSAQGLVSPDEVLAPYDVMLKDARTAERRQWSQKVLETIDEKITLRPGDFVEIHAGAEYRDTGLVEGLRSRGCVVVIPTEGMRIGVQLQFYARARGERR